MMTLAATRLWTLSVTHRPEDFVLELRRGKTLVAQSVPLAGRALRIAFRYDGSRWLVHDACEEPTTLIAFEGEPEENWPAGWVFEDLCEVEPSADDLTPP